MPISIAIDDEGAAKVVRPRTGPRVGVAVLLRNSSGRILWIRRVGVGDGLWAVPGGGVEDDEDPAAAARRELMEETGVVADDLRPCSTWVYSPALSDGLSWITLYFEGRFRGFAEERAIAGDSVPRIMEPTKCSSMLWAFPEELERDRVFDPMRRYIDAVAGRAGLR